MRLCIREENEGSEEMIRKGLAELLSLWKANNPSGTWSCPTTTPVVLLSQPKVDGAAICDDVTDATQQSGQIPADGEAMAISYEFEDSMDMSDEDGSEESAFPPLFGWW
jgi:hypothetical protein